MRHISEVKVEVLKCTHSKILEALSTKSMCICVETNFLYRAGAKAEDMKSVWRIKMH